MLETNDIGKLSDLQKELESIQEEQLLLMEEWENLNMRLDL